MKDAIFITYRRADTIQTANHIYDRLQQAFGQESVFMDMMSIPPGDKFRAHIAEVLQSCRVAVVIIGPKWLAADESGTRRIDDPNDLVRIEVESVLARGIRVIPTLVDGATQFTAADLPEALKSLAEMQSIVIRHGAEFNHGIQTLIATITEILPPEALPPQTGPFQTFPPQTGPLRTWPPQASGAPTWPPQSFPPATPPATSRGTALRRGVGVIVALTLIAALALFYNAQLKAQLAGRSTLIGAYGPVGTATPTGTAAATRTASATRTAGSTGGPSAPGGPSQPGVPSSGGPAPTPTPRPAKLAWRFPTGGQINATPAVIGGTVYFTSEDHYIYAVNTADASLRWRYQTASELTASPTVVGGVLYAGSGDGYMYALNASTGALLWKHGGGLSIVTNVAYANGVVYYEEYTSQTSFVLYALQASDGTQVWQKALNQASNTPLVVGSTVYVSSGSTLEALAASSGSVIWSYNFSAGISDPVYAGGVIYASGAGRLVAFNASSGSVLWQQSGLGKPTIINGTAYGLADGGSSGAGAVYAVRASNGALLWKTATSHHPWQLVTYDNGVLYAHGNDHYLQAYSASNGKFLWSVSLKYDALASNVLLPFSYPTVSNGVVYVGSYDSNLYAYILP